jgi:pantothenate kinase type III
VQAGHAIVTHALREARALLKRPAMLVLSGGGADAVARMVAHSAHAPELVIAGLAVLAAQQGS